jgi:hypothetical protein
MATKKSSKLPEKKTVSGEIFFITNSSLPRNVGFRENSGNGSNALTRKASEVKEDWNNMMNQLNDIMANSEKAAGAGRYEMDEIAVKLAFTAKGRLAFIAEAGVEASIEVKFKRK